MSSECCHQNKPAEAVFSPVAAGPRFRFLREGLIGWEEGRHIDWQHWGEGCSQMEIRMLLPRGGWCTGGQNPLIPMANQWNIQRMEVHAKCLAQKRKEGACGYLTKNAGKFTEEAMFTPSAFLQGQRTWGMETTRQPSLASRKQQTVATAKRSTMWACVTSTAEAPPGTSARYYTSSLPPGPWPVPHRPEWPPEMSRGQGLGKSSFSLPARREN